MRGLGAGRSGLRGWVLLFLCVVVSGFLTDVALAKAVSWTVTAAGDEAGVKQRLMGNWKLVKYEVFNQDGDVRPGNYDVGRLMYDEREMTAHLMRTGAHAYLGYFGPYAIDADKGVVVHHVAGSSLESWIGSEQVRYYGFTPDGHLTLSLKSGDRITQTLTWERVR